jgi:hypothetical protein
MLEKYHGPVAAGDELALDAAALQLSFEFNPPTKYNDGGTWFRNLYVSKGDIRRYRKDHAPAGVIPPEIALIDLDPKKVAAKIREKFARFEIDRPAEILAGLPRVIDWLIKFEQALREDDDDGDDEVEVEA